MESRKDIRDELNELSPLLSKLDKREGFQVPPRYFEKLTHEVLQKATTESTTTQTVPQWQQNLSNIWAAIWQPKMAMALATFALLAVATTFYLDTGSETDPLAELSSISDEELDFYIQENFDELDLELFADINDASVDDFIPMKKLLSILVICLLVSSYAQAQKKGKRQEKIKSLRIAFITDKLQLTTDESEKFWPLYNEYDSKRKALRKSFQKNKRTDELTDDEAEKQINAKFESQEKMIQLKRSYFEKFKKVLPAKKVAQLGKAEREFRAVVLKERRKRRAKEGKGNAKRNQRQAN